MSPAEIHTLVIHHPSRPAECLLRTISSLRAATKRTQLIDLVVHGPEDGVYQGLTDAVSFHPNGHPGTARFQSMLRFSDGPARYWAKLDDDGALPPGAWDDMILAMEEAGDDVACAMANPEGARAPRMLEIGGLGVMQSEESFRSGETWRECEFVGDGATIFRRECFEEGAAWDPNFIRSADIDFAMQLKNLGLTSLLCDPPRSLHFHKECSPLEYDMRRYDARLVWESAAVFKKKWGLPCVELEQFGQRSFEGR